MSSLQRLVRAATPSHRVPSGSSQWAIPGYQRPQSPGPSRFQCPGLELRTTPEPFHLPETGFLPKLGYGEPGTAPRPFPSRSANHRVRARQHWCPWLGLIPSPPRWLRDSHTPGFQSGDLPTNKLSTGRTSLAVRSGIGRRFHFTIGSSLHRLKLQSFEPRPKAMTNADLANKRRIPAISTKIYWVKVRRTTRKANSHAKLKTQNSKLKTPCSLTSAIEQNSKSPAKIACVF